MINHDNPPVPFSRLVAYLRKSRADGEESVEEVLAKHERILQDYVTSTWGVPLPDSKIFREVQSGETIAARPVMQQLIGTGEELNQIRVLGMAVTLQKDLTRR